jgi:hypothetical protein
LPQDISIEIFQGQDIAMEQFLSQKYLRSEKRRGEIIQMSWQYTKDGHILTKMVPIL